MDLRHIHRENVFGPSLRRLKVKGQGHWDKKMAFFGPFGSLRAVYVWLNIFSL